MIAEVYHETEYGRLVHIGWLATMRTNELGIPLVHQDDFRPARGSLYRALDGAVLYGAPAQTIRLKSWRTDEPVTIVIVADS